MRCAGRIAAQTRSQYQQNLYARGWLPCPDLTSDEPHQSQCQSRPQPALQHRRPHRRRHCERERCFRVSSSAACEGMTYERQCIPFSNAKARRNARVRPVAIKIKLIGPFPWKRSYRGSVGPPRRRSFQSRAHYDQLVPSD